MKVYYYFSNSRKEKDEVVVKAIYGKNAILCNDKPSILINRLEKGDILICYSVEEFMEDDRLTVDIEEIVKIYMSLAIKGVELTFDKSAQCNSLFIKTLISNEEEFEGVLRKCILNYLGQKNIEQKYSKKHVVFAKNNGHKMGMKKGTKFATKKSIETKKIILERSREFNGTLTDGEIITTLKISRNAYYKYKKELLEGGN